MNITTKFNIGDKVCTIDTASMKLREFEIGYVSVYVNKDGVPDVSYRAVEDGFSGDRYAEEKVFSNEADLMKFITTPTPAKSK